jgi:hypothetical protein
MYFASQILSFLLVAAIALHAPTDAFAGVPLKAIGTLLSGTKWVKLALPDANIVELAALASKPGGTKVVGEVLGKMKLPTEALEDTYTRILIHQGKLPREEAEGMFGRLSGTPGMVSAMSKSIGVSAAKTAGHLNEVRIADNAAQINLKVKGIGVRFNDPNKAAPTDIDVLLEHRGREVAIEAKDYLPTTEIPLDSFRADMLSLAEYRRRKPEADVLPVFWITNKPNDPNVWRSLEKAAEHYQVELIVGPPDEAIHQIPLLLRH